MKKYLMVVLDGAGDLARFSGQTPLQIANLPAIDSLCKEGYGGLMRTLYEDLPKGSIVAQLGMLGYDPYKYYPNGRASCEAAALDIKINRSDIAFRANLSLIQGEVLRSFNANYIKSEISADLIKKLNSCLKDEFPEFELYHNSDFRNTLIFRDIGIEPSEFECIEPHENMGRSFDFKNLVSSKTVKSNKAIKRLNNYIFRTTEILKGHEANVIFPWSPSSKLVLPPFKTQFEGKSAIIAHMDFLKGIAVNSGIDFFKEGNGNWDTDYNSKFERIIKLFNDGYSFVYCHINGPDEASHMGDLQKKIYSLETSDNKILAPTIDYFKSNPEELGGILVTTDHFTNLHAINLYRVEAHSADLVPFVIYDGKNSDDMLHFDEDSALHGHFGEKSVNHLDILKLLFRGIDAI